MQHSAMKVWFSTRDANDRSVQEFIVDNLIDRLTDPSTSLNPFSANPKDLRVLPFMSVVPIPKITGFCLVLHNLIENIVKRVFGVG